MILEGEKKGNHNSTFNYFEQHFMNGIPYSILLVGNYFLALMDMMSLLETVMKIGNLI